MIAIHGGRPYAAVSTTTAAPATPRAAHCNGRNRSPRTKTPISTMTRGLMK